MTALSFPVVFIFFSTNSFEGFQNLFGVTHRRAYQGGQKRKNPDSSNRIYRQFSTYGHRHESIRQQSIRQQKSPHFKSNRDMPDLPESSETAIEELKCVLLLIIADDGHITPETIYCKVSDLKQQIRCVLEDIMRFVQSLPLFNIVPIDRMGGWISSTFEVCEFQDQEEKSEPLFNRRAVGFITGSLLNVLEDLNVCLKVHSSDTQTLNRLKQKRWRHRDVTMLDIILCKLNLIYEFLPFAAAVPLEEYIVTRTERLTNEKYIKANNLELMEMQTNRFFTNLFIALGFCSYGYNEKCLPLRYLKILGGIAYFGLRVKQSQQLANHVGMQPDPMLLKYLWNLTETSIVRVMLKLSFPSVKKHKTFLVPANPPVPVRYLSSSPENHESSLILHFHGGGFICHTSFSHQTYTRQWANETGVPVLSIDYRTAPESQFPAALDDAWSVYLWLVQGDTKYQLGYTPERIVIAGDSAGGNLAVAVTIRAIERGVKAPYGLQLMYPALSLERTFSPSLLLTLKDRLVPVGFIETCRLAYVPLGADMRDPMISPLFVSDNVLKSFPPTNLMVGSLDPLMDQSIVFAHRLECVGVKYSLSIYEGMLHGFLNLDSVFVGIEEARRTILDASNGMKGLLTFF